MVRADIPITIANTIIHIPIEQTRIRRIIPVATQIRNLKNLLDYDIQMWNVNRT